MDQNFSPEDTRRLIIAIALTAAILLVWSVFFSPEPPPSKTAEPAPREATGRPLEEPDSAAVPGRATGPAGVPAEAGAGEEASGEPTAPVASEPIAAEGREEVFVDTGVARIKLVNRGAVAHSWRLVEYEGYATADPVELVHRRAFFVNLYPLQLRLPEHPEATEALAKAYWKTERERSGEETVVRFTWADGRGLEAEKTITFRRGSYLAEVEARAAVGGRAVPVQVLWGPGIANHPSEVRSNKYFQSPRVVAVRGGDDYEAWTDAEDVPDLEASTVSWAGVDDQYFAALFLPAGVRTGVSYSLPTEGLETPAANGEDDEDDYPAPLLAYPLAPGGERIPLFVGPKRLQILQELEGGDFAQIIDMGRWIGPIARVMLHALIWIHEHVVTNYGWGIILLTILIRLLFFPLTQRSMRKMREMAAKMKKIQPQQKAIKAKYKGSKDVGKQQKMNEELMALYRREGINPADQLSGCLPMVIQMPIFFGFFRMLPAAIELRKEPWILWIQDLSQPDPYFVTPLLMGAAMFASMRRSASQQTQMEGFQKQIFSIMPVMFTVICLWAPSGLVVYWLFSNLIQMGQQELLRRSTDEDGDGDDGGGKKKGGGKKSSGKKGKKK